MREAISSWGTSNRRDFPWRREPSPYHILLAEICLRRTGAKPAEPVYRDLIESFPTIDDLANAGVKDLERMIAPIGLRSRASELSAIARELARTHHSQVPSSYSDLVALKGVGKYIANAVLCFGYGKRRATVDLSIVRMLDRFYDLSSGSSSRRSTVERECWLIAENLVPAHEPAAFNYSALDLAAKICTPANPNCSECPLMAQCEWHKVNPDTG